MKSLRIIYHCDDNELNLNIVLVLHYRKLFVMRILLTPLFILFFIANHAQSEELKLVYSSSTEEANNEIKNVINTSRTNKKFKQIDSKDFIFLLMNSTIKLKLMRKNLTIRTPINMLNMYISNQWFSRYKSTSQLINELKNSIYTILSILLLTFIFFKKSIRSMQ